MKKRIVAIVLAIVLLVGIVACVAGCNNDKQPEATSFVTMDINPSVNLVLDQNNNVISYSAENEDAMIMLYGQNIIGLSVDEASQKIIDLAIEFGYLTEDNSGIQVSVASDNSKVETNILDKIGVVVEKFEGKLSFELTYDKEGSFVLNYQLAKLKDANPDNENYQNLTAGKLQLVYSAMSCDWSLTMDDAVAMSNEELLAIVDNGYSQLEQYSTKAYEQVKKASQYAYESLVISAKDAVYLEKYAKFKNDGSLGGIIEGGLGVVQYGAVMAASRGLNELVKGLALAEQYANNILATQDAQAIATELGIDVELLKDNQGNLTIESIGAYIDKVAKNNAQEIQGELGTKLNNAVAKLDEYKQANEEKVLTNDVLTSIQTLLATISTKIDGIEFSFDMSLDDIKQIANNLEEYALETKAEMDESLTDEQKQEIADAQKQAETKLADAYESYLAKLDEAKATAEAYLEQARQDRLDYLASLDTQA